MMLSYGLLDDLVMDVQQPQHAGFSGAHLAAKADDVGEHDGRQLTSLGGYFISHLVLVLVVRPSTSPSTSSGYAQDERIGILSRAIMRRTPLHCQITYKDFACCGVEGSQTMRSFNVDAALL